MTAKSVHVMLVGGPAAGRIVEMLSDLPVIEVNVRPESKLSLPAGTKVAMALSEERVPYKVRHIKHADGSIKFYVGLFGDTDMMTELMTGYMAYASAPEAGKQG